MSTTWPNCPPSSGHWKKWGKVEAELQSAALSMSIVETPPALALEVAAPEWSEL